MEGFNRQLRKVTKNKSFPIRRQPPKNALSDNDGYHEKMDRPSSGLKPDALSVGNQFGRTIGKTPSLKSTFS